MPRGTEHCLLHDALTLLCGSLPVLGCFLAASLFSCSLHAHAAGGCEQRLAGLEAPSTHVHQACSWLTLQPYWFGGSGLGKDRSLWEQISRMIEVRWQCRELRRALFSRVALAHRGTCLCAQRCGPTCTKPTPELRFCFGHYRSLARWGRDAYRHPCRQKLVRASVCIAIRARARRAPALQDRGTRCCVLMSRLRSGVARCGSLGSLPPPAVLLSRTPLGRGQPTPARLGAPRAEAAQPRSEHGRRFPAPRGRGRGGRADPGRLLRRTRPAPPRSHAGRPRPPPARPGPPLRRRPPSPRSPSPHRRIPLLPLLLLLRPRGCARGAPREPRVVPVGLPALAPRARITFLPGKSPPRIRRSPLLPSWEAARGRAELRRVRLGAGCGTDCAQSRGRRRSDAEGNPM